MKHITITKKNTGIIIYGLVLASFLSCKKDNEFEYALIQTGNVTNIDNTGATFHARISDLGKTNIIEYGFVWGLESEPKNNSSKIVFVDNPEIGIISERITNDIIPDTIYYVQAYAKNGSYITYGKEIAFRSKGSLPPKIFDFSPKIGTNNTKIAIMGDNFSGGLEGNIVMFGGAEAQIDSASKNKLIVTLPNDLSISGLVNISVEVANHRVVSDSTFYLEGCIIHGFVPEKIFGGDIISIHAENYSQNIMDNIIFIGYRKAEIVEIINDTIKAIVPYNTSFGKNEISITINNKISISEDSVIVKNPWDKIENDYTFHRGGAIGFSIDNYGFVGLGVDKNDLWKYDINENEWIRCANLPDVERKSAVAFAISGKGYICLGSPTYYTGKKYFNDLYEYDPEDNSWEKKSEFPGDGRNNSFSIVIGNKAYVGLGGSYGFDAKKDFWEYDPVLDKWTRLADYPSSGGYQVVGFSINNKGYIGLGMGENVYPVQKDFWEYDPAKDTWKKLADFPGTERRMAVSFALDSFGYIGLGWKASGYGGILNDFWRYDVKNNSWTRIADLPYNGRAESVNFVINNKAYICSGVNNYSYYENHKESLIVFNPNDK